MKFFWEGNEVELRGITGKLGNIINSNIIAKLQSKEKRGVIAQLCSLEVPHIKIMYFSKSPKCFVQSFLGKINFVRRFIPNFAELVKHITSMLKKGLEIKWTDASRSSFEAIKQAIMEAPILISPNYTKDFCIFSFASYDTLAAVLL